MKSGISKKTTEKNKVIFCSKLPSAIILPQVFASL